MKKLYFVFTSIILISINTYALSNEEISLVDELSQIRINESDRMQIIFFERPFFNHKKISGIKFKEKEYFIYEIYKSSGIDILYSAKKSHEMKELFRSAGEDVYRHYNNAISHYREGDTLMAEIDLINAIMRFNHIISHSPAARNRIAESIRILLTPDVKYSRFKREWQNKRPLYFGIYGALLFNSEIDLTNTYSNPIGIRCEFFFLAPLKPFNVGMSLGVHYMNISPMRKINGEKIFVTYLAFNPMVLFKFFFPEISFQHTFVLGLGADVIIKLSDDNMYENRTIRKNFSGFNCEIGYRYYSASLNTSFGFNVNIKVSSSFVESSYSGTSVGFNMFLGFLL